MSNYDPTPQQEKAIREYLHESIVPLIEQVLVKKLGQAMSYAAQELVSPKREWVGDSGSGSFVSWDNTKCNPLAPAREQARSAWEDGYATAKREWVGLTDEYLDELMMNYGYDADDECMREMLKDIEAKLKEKNT